MRQRRVVRFRPRVERFEDKRLLNAGALTGAVADVATGATVQALHAGMAQRQKNTAPRQFVLQRITDPEGGNSRLVPPFQQVLVQAPQPKPGQTYNVFSISMRNQTRQTFDASDGLLVKLTNQKRWTPVLTGDQQWKPGQVIVFYLLTKQYYPVGPVISGGFQFNFASGVAVPGPSAIFLRIKYDPARFPALLNWITVRGPGAKGHELGLPDTSIWQFISAKTNIVPL